MKRTGKIFASTITILALSLLLGIASSRTVRAAVTALVTVANTSANPVPATDVGPQQPYTTNCYTVVYNYYIGCVVTIPPGKLFITENVSLYVQADNTVGPTGAGIIPDNNSGVVFYINVPPYGAQGNVNNYSVDQPFKAYIGATPGPCFASFSNFTNATLSCSMSGYLVDAR